MVFRLDSASTAPKAIAALSKGAKVAHAADPSIKPKTRILPAQAIRRSRAEGESSAGAEHRGNGLTEACSNGVLTTSRPRFGRKDREPFSCGSERRAWLAA